MKSGAVNEESFSLYDFSSDWDSLLDILVMYFVIPFLFANRRFLSQLGSGCFELSLALRN